MRQAGQPVAGLQVKADAGRGSHGEPLSIADALEGSDEDIIVKAEITCLLAGDVRGQPIELVFSVLLVELPLAASPREPVGRQVLHVGGNRLGQHIRNFLRRNALQWRRKRAHAPDHGCGEERDAIAVLAEVDGVYRCARALQPRNDSKDAASFRRRRNDPAGTHRAKRDLPQLTVDGEDVRGSGDNLDGHRVRARRQVDFITYRHRRHHLPPRPVRSTFPWQPATRYGFRVRQACRRGQARQSHRHREWCSADAQ
ncbi:unannotated protein [freshwater metagenome]|uniref:Unannotated protein n=1 Tax=freshwater metagenome TaxID=449393 RepID=A0A6J7EJR7_9ZZZZ